MAPSPPEARPEDPQIRVRMVLGGVGVPPGGEQQVGWGRDRDR
jgi:hypothetical protein